MATAQEPMGTPIPNPVCQTRDFHERPNRIRNKLKQSLLSKLAQTNPSIPITSVHDSYIDRKLQELFQSFQTPRHPPYALMIQSAVKELNEEGGSCKEDISGFIERVFEDLPWAHQTILGYHLRKLCENQELVKTECGKYMLLPESSDLIAGREVGMEKRVTSECEFGGSKDGIVERREEIVGQTESPDSQIMEAAGSDLQETGQEQVNKKVQHGSKEHPQQDAEEHLELKEDQVLIAEAQTEQERQESGVTEGQAEIAVELSEDMLKERKKSDLIRKPDEEEAHDVRNDDGHGELEVSKEKAKNSSEMWELTAQNLDEQQEKLEPEMHLSCGIPYMKPITDTCPKVDLPSFGYTSKLAAALRLERTVRSQSFQVNSLPDKQNEVSFGEIRPNDPPFLETNSSSLLYSSDHHKSPRSKRVRPKTPTSKSGRTPKENGNMDLSAEMAVTADTANLEQQATPVHSLFNPMKDLGCGGENGSPSCVLDEEQILDYPIQLQCEIGDDSKESTAAATSDNKQMACAGFSGLQMPNSGTLHCHAPWICPYRKREGPPHQKLDASPVQALSAPNFCSSEYHGQHQSQPKKCGRPRKEKLDSKDVGDSGDRKEFASHLEKNSQCQLNREDQIPLQHFEFVTPDHKNQVLEQTAEAGSSQMEMTPAPSGLDLNYDERGHPQPRRGRPRKQEPRAEPPVKKQKLKEFMALSSVYRKKLRPRTYPQSKRF